MATAPDRLVVGVHVRPGGRRDEVGGEHDGALVVRVSARAVDGRANEAVRRVVAEAFGVPRRDVELVGGATSRRKRLAVHGDVDGLRQRLSELLRGGPDR